MAKDILLDEDDDLLIINGDLVVDDSTDQEIYLIMKSNQGEWKQSPTTGFGFVKRMRGQQTAEEMKKDLDTQLQLDGLASIFIEAITDDSGIVKLNEVRAVRP